MLSIKWPLTLTCDLDLEKQGAKMCCSSRYMCVPIIEFVCILSEKLWPMLKLWTDRQGKNNTSPIWGHKKHRYGGIKSIEHLVWKPNENFHSLNLSDNVLGLTHFAIPNFFVYSCGIYPQSLSTILLSSLRLPDKLITNWTWSPYLRAHDWTIKLSV